MSQDSATDPLLDVPDGEIIAQEDVPEGPAEGNSLLTALGGGAVDEFDDDPPAPPKRFSTQTAIIAGIAIGGGAMIFAMRQYEKKQGVDMTFDMTLIPTVIDDTEAASVDLTPNETLVLNTLSAADDPIRAPATIDKNPFIIESQGPVEVTETGQVVQGPDVESLTRDYMSKFNSIQVSSIITTGPRPVAVVNRRATMVGSTVGDYFVVREIGMDEMSHSMFIKVELVGYHEMVDGEELILHLRSGG